MQRTQALGIDPIVDYVFPIWPTINCFNPARSDNSQITPSLSFTSYLTAVQNKAKQFTQSGLFFTAQCAPCSTKTSTEPPPLQGSVLENAI